MKNLEWNDSLSVEVDEIDEDHRRLVDIFNVLTRAVSEEHTIEYIDAVLEELISCTVWHFRHEERLMILYKYPEFAQHRQEHQELIASVRELQQKFHDESMGKLESEDIEFLSDWLTGHILGHDMRLGFFLLKVMGND